LKLLAFDIETAPALVYTFGLFKPYLGPGHIVEPDRIICWSAKWVGEGKKVMFASEYHNGRIEMLTGLRDLIVQADAVLGYNSKNFDIPWINAELLLEGIEGIPNVKHIDLYQVQRAKTRHISGKLQYLVQRYLNERKVPHEGLQMWIDCISPTADPVAKAKAWKTMKKYAMHDTALLEPAYELYKPFLSGANAINVALVDGIDPKLGCPNCGSTHIQRRGKEFTAKRIYHRLQCQNCKTWHRGEVVPVLP
jgi:DNA polymerase elongation subunit (family B)